MGRIKLTEQEKKDKLKEYARKYYLKNKERLVKYKKTYYEDNKEEYLLRRKLELKKQVELEEHSLVSPSVLHRALVCPASIVYSKDLPNVETDYAKEGTAFHKLMEFNNSTNYRLKETLNKLFPNDFTDKVKEDLIFNQANLIEVLNNLKKNIKDKGFEIKEYKELQLPMYYSDKDKGTMDLGIVGVNSNSQAVVVVCDYKYGMGVDVAIENNPQLISYAISFIKYLLKENHNLKIIKVITCILQPRISNAIKTIGYTLDELKEKGKYINDGVKVVYDVCNKSEDEVKSYEHVSEEGCRFCPAKSLCKKYNEENLSLLSDLPVIKDTAVISNDDVIKVLEFEKTILPKITEYIKVIKSSVENRLLSGEKIEGLKLINTNTRLKWIDDKDKIINTLLKLGVDAVDHEVSIKSIGSIKKLIKDDSVLKDLTIKPLGKPQVVLDTDVKLLNNIN